MAIERPQGPVAEYVDPITQRSLEIEAMIKSNPAWEELPWELKGIAKNIALPISFIEDDQQLANLAKTYEVTIVDTQSLIVQKATFVKTTATRKLTQLYTSYLGTEKEFSEGQKANTITLAVAALRPRRYQQEPEALPKKPVVDAVLKSNLL
jgi:hypothetical protein